MRAALIAFAALAGCTTTLSEIRDHQPRATYQSSKSPAALEQCLADALSWMGAPSIIRGETETTLAYTITSHTHFTLSLTAGASTTVAVRGIHGYNGRQRRGVEGCI